MKLVRSWGVGGRGRERKEEREREFYEEGGLTLTMTPLVEGCSSSPR